MDCKAKYETDTKHATKTNLILLTIATVGLISFVISVLSF